MILIGFILGDYHIKLDLSYDIYLIHMLVIGTLKYFNILGERGLLMAVVLVPILALAFHYSVKKITVKLRKITASLII